MVLLFEMHKNNNIKKNSKPINREFFFLTHYIEDAIRIETRSKMIRIAYEQQKHRMIHNELVSHFVYVQMSFSIFILSFLFIQSAGNGVVFFHSLWIHASKREKEK